MASMPLGRAACALVAGLVVGLSGCSVSTTRPVESGGGAAATIRLPDKVRSKGALDIAAFANYPPYTTLENGRIGGIEPDLVRAVAAKLGVEARFHDLAFEAMIPSVVNGRNDLAIGMFADTPERRGQVGFVDIIRSEMRALVLKGNPRKVDPAKPCGLTSGESAGSYQSTIIKSIAKRCAADGEPELKQHEFTDPGASFLAVVNGRTDLTLQDPAVAKYTAGKNPALEMLHTPIKGDASLLSGWIFAKGNQELRTAFVQAIEQLMKEGTWQKKMADAGLGEVLLQSPTIDTQPVKGS
ncbi:MAG: transporter substrate-binding domain-containing protein [Spirillospora sp.]